MIRFRVLPMSAGSVAKITNDDSPSKYHPGHALLDSQCCIITNMTQSISKITQSLMQSRSPKGHRQYHQYSHQLHWVKFYSGNGGQEQREMIQFNEELVLFRLCTMSKHWNTINAVKCGIFQEGLISRCSMVNYQALQKHPQMLATSISQPTPYTLNVQFLFLFWFLVFFGFFFLSIQDMYILNIPHNKVSIVSEISN